MNHLNSHTKRQIQDQAQRQFEELRWRLNFLETLGIEVAKEPSEEEILKWYINQQHLN